MSGRDDPEASTDGTSSNDARAANQRRLAGYRYGVVLLLIASTFVFLSLAPSGRWARVASTALQGLTLLAAFVASGVRPRVLRVAGIIVVVAVVGTVVSVVTAASGSYGDVLLVQALLVAGAPVAITRGLLRQGTIDMRTVLGAICIYLLLGLLFAFSYSAIGAINSEPFFAQGKSATSADYIYFSYVTQTTVGYGDLTAAGQLGRTLAAMEALIGQLYLVTVVALLVGNIGRPRAARGP